jgi:hypothetical protein
MLVKTYEVVQKDNYVNAGFSQFGLVRDLEKESDLWSIDPQMIMPYRARIMTGITQISDGSFIRAQFGTTKIS